MNSSLLRQRWLAWAFLLLLILPCLAEVVGVGQSSELVEKRTFAPWPGLPASLEDVISYPSRMESYLQDHLGLKRELAFIPGLKYRFSDDIVAGSVIVGKNKQLFTLADNSINKHEGKICLSPDQLLKWTDRLLALKQATEAVGGRFVATVAPDKQSIYPDELPERMQPRGTGCVIYNQAVRAAAKRGITVIDLRQPLVSARAQGMQTFFRNDTHWNETGALLAYRQIRARAALSAPLPALQPIRETILGGDLANELNMPSAQDVVWTYQLAQNPPTRRSYLSDVESFKSYKPVLYERDGPGLTALVIGDSFTDKGLIKFLLIDANRLVWSPTCLLENDLALVQRFKPRLVVFEQAERTIGAKWPN